MTAGRSDLGQMNAQDRRALLQRLVSARSARPHTAPTSFNQREMWFLNRLDPDSPAYNIARAYRVSGPLDIASLRAAWRAVAQRHEVFRTTFAEVDGLPVQVISPESNATLDVVDLSAAPSADRDRLALDLFTGQARAPFDLTRGPLARLTLIQLGDRDHLLVLVMHHAMTDGWSVPIIFDELDAYYRAALEGDPARAGLPPLPASYGDFARWQREQAETPEHQRLLDRWIERLTPLPPPLSLPTDRPRPAQRSLRGTMLPFDWGESLARSLAELSRTQGVTAFMVLLAAFQGLLHRLSGEDRIAVGVPTAGRSHPRFERLIGCFVNPLPLCTDLSGQISFRTLLDRVRRVTLEALDGQDVPVERLVQALNPPHDTSRNPLFDVNLVVQSVAEVPLRLHGTTVRVHDVDLGTARFDLALCVNRLEPRLVGHLEYSTDLFEPDSAARILEQLHTFLSAALADLNRPVDDLPLDPPERLRRDLAAADAIAAAEPPRATVGELVRRRVRQGPHLEAVRWDGSSLSYQDLGRWADQIAAALTAGGLQPGAAVAVRLPAGAPHVAALLAVHLAGGHFVCLPPTDPAGRCRRVLVDLRPPVLLVDDLADELVGWYRTEVGGGVVDVTALPDRPGPAAEPAGLDQPAYLVYTAGSTGEPKGIVQSHRGFAQFVGWMGERFAMGSGRRIAQWAAPNYDAAFCEIFATLAAGGTLCPVPERVRMDAERLVDWLIAERVQVLQTVPSFARELLRALRDRGGAGQLAGTLDTLLLAGETLPGELAADLRAALPAARLVNLYGPTETILATWFEVTEPQPGTVPVGRAIPGRAVLVLDRRQRPCPAGVTGEIAVAGPYLTMGYLGRPADTAAAFAPREAGGEPCYRTGDLGRWRYDGTLEFRGRRDDQVKLRGMRVELAEIEAALAEHDSVRECAVLPDTSDPAGSQLVDRLVAYVVPRRTSSVAEWRAHLRRWLPEPMVPAVFTVLDQLPRNAGGKVDRQRLPAPDAAPQQDFRPPATDVERGVAAIWAEVLKTDRIGAEANFFALGGHSLLATQVLNRTRERFGVDAPLRAFFADPTVAGLARLLDPATAGEPADELDDLRRHIDALSDEEARRYLAQYRADTDTHDI